MVGVRALCALAAASLAASGLPSAWAQSIERGFEVDIAREFMALELAGWRLPDPTEACLAQLQLRRLDASAFGASEMIDQPELVDPPGPHFRNLRVDPDPSDRRRRAVRFEWLLSDPRGTRAQADSFVFVINEAGGESGAAAMVQEPRRLVIRRECFGG